jgi:hypothetical protein
MAVLVAMGVYRVKPAIGLPAEGALGVIPEMVVCQELPVEHDMGLVVEVVQQEEDHSPPE